jgi:uncharacterized protein YjbI with pentapeptide repeats
MANAEHLRNLRAGVEHWNRWRKEHHNLNILLKLTEEFLFKPDLTEANLIGVDLIGADLSFADLTGANLFNVNLANSNLTFSNLTGANLFNSKLAGANLTGADLNKADLSFANMTEATFFTSNLSGANMTGTNLYRTDFSSAILAETQIANAELGYTIFGLANLNGCIGLESVVVKAPCIIDFHTLRSSSKIPNSFLKKIGLPELYIDYLPDFYMDSLTYYPVFLSHSWENKDFARKLYDALIAKGVGVFFDEKKIRPGDDFYESLSQGIEYYDKMILVCSKASLSESWWVDREIDRVLAKERELMKERGKRINLLIPIMVDNFVFEWEGAKKEEIRRYRIGDFREWKDEGKFESALNDLLHALNVDRPDIKPKSHL